MNQFEFFKYLEQRNLCEILSIWNNLFKIKFYYPDDDLVASIYDIGIQGSKKRFSIIFVKTHKLKPLSHESLISFDLFFNSIQNLELKKIFSFHLDLFL